MLKTKIIAADLQNLTDARYFAAWLVDYMSFNFSEPNVNLPKIKEIMDWVEGPIFCAQYTGLEESNYINDHLVALSIDHLLLGPYAKDELVNSDWQVIQTTLLEEDIKELTANRSYIIQSHKTFDQFSQDEKNTLKKQCRSHSIYLDCDFKSTNIEDILTLGITGLVLRGGEEEKVGVKSYDDLDKIMEALEE